MFLPAEKVFELMNAFGSKAQPFVFGIDFEVKNGFFIEPEEAGLSDIYFNINGFKNDLPTVNHESLPVKLVKEPVEYPVYNSAFLKVQSHIVAGNSYLVNLTFPTGINLNLTLPEIFARSRARYCLLFGEQFVVFSPETFVRIKDGIIRSFPMKGTIDASLPDAKNAILTNAKETAEHNTIVDLIRNDLSMVASDVKVDRFRYVEKIFTHEKSLLQVISEISGVLPSNYQSELGTLFSKLLPAGSISGAPKKKTLQIIKEAETYSRGFYTGVFGYFDGSQLDSGVMIRYIKNTKGELTFCSGGGITVNSEAKAEYNELIDKVYVPFI
jgi:para-aminobenzoate synthetase component 1